MSLIQPGTFFEKHLKFFLLESCYHLPEMVIKTIKFFFFLHLVLFSFNNNEAIKQMQAELMNNLFKSKTNLGKIAHAFKPRTQEAKADRSLSWKTD